MNLRRAAPRLLYTRPPFGAGTGWPLWVAATLAALLFAAGLHWTLSVSAGASLGLIALGLGLLLPVHLQKAFLGALAVLLAGYAFLDRGFAHLGAPPVFVGEMVLALGLAAIIPTGAFGTVLRSPVAWAYLAFAAWGAFRTLPYIDVQGANALRDAVLWGYGIFCILVAAALLRRGCVARVPELYRRVLPWLLAWIPVGMIFFKIGGESLAEAAGSSLPFVSDFGADPTVLKPGDMAVHLAGAAAFLVLGLHQMGRLRGERGAAVKEWGWWLAWTAGFVLTASLNRGGMLAIFTAVSVAAILSPTLRWFRSLLKPVVAGVLLASLFFVLNLEIDVGAPRKISAQQITANVESILGRNSQQNLEVTQDWRSRWWSEIVHYTVFGEYFWTGKGYGVNLERDDGFVTWGDFSSRNPHNAHLAVLARSGVPGLGLWLLLHGLFAAGMLGAYVRARSEGRTWWARLDAWILAYWSAFLINASFDVYLEGPQGGIWFWSLMGFGVAAMLAQRAERRAPGWRLTVVESIPAA